MRYLTDDLLPVFLGAGRGSLSLAREIHRAYGAKSVILAEEGTARYRLPFARFLPVSPRLWQEALWDLVKKEPVGRAAMLLPGTAAGARAMAQTEERNLARYLPIGCFSSRGCIREGDRLVTGYRAEDGTVTFSRPARVLAAEGGLPLVLASEAGAFGKEEAHSLLPREGWGYFTLSVGEDVTLLPYLAEGGALLAASGLCAGTLAVRDRVLCLGGREASPEEAEGFAPFLWQGRGGAYRKADVSAGRFLWERVSARVVTEKRMPPPWNAR